MSRLIPSGKLTTSVPWVIEVLQFQDPRALLQYLLFTDCHLLENRDSNGDVRRSSYQKPGSFAVVVHHEADGQPFHETGNSFTGFQRKKYTSWMSQIYIHWRTIVRAGMQHNATHTTRIDNSILGAAEISVSSILGEHCSDLWSHITVTCPRWCQQQSINQLQRVSEWVSTQNAVWGDHDVRIPRPDAKPTPRCMCRVCGTSQSARQAMEYIWLHNYTLRAKNGNTMWEGIECAKGIFVPT